MTADVDSSTTAVRQQYDSYDSYDSRQQSTAIDSSDSSDSYDSRSTADRQQNPSVPGVSDVITVIAVIMSVDRSTGRQVDSGRQRSTAVTAVDSATGNQSATGSVVGIGARITTGNQQTSGNNFWLLAVVLGKCCARGSPMTEACPQEAGCAPSALSSLLSGLRRGPRAARHRILAELDEGGRHAAPSRGQGRWLRRGLPSERDRGGSWAATRRRSSVGQ